MNCSALGQDSSKLAGRVAASVIAAIDDAVVHLSRHGATAVRLAGGADAVVTGIGNGAGIAVANLVVPDDATLLRVNFQHFARTEASRLQHARKELVANRGIFELLHFKP